MLTLKISKKYSNMNNYYSKFIKKYLPDQLKKHFISNINYDIFLNIDAYLKNKLNLKITCKDIILKALDILVLIKDIDYDELQVNNEVYIENPNIRLIDIVKLIEYGNLELAGRHIFEKLFNIADRNIPIWILDFKRRGS